MRHSSRRAPRERAVPDDQDRVAPRLEGGVLLAQDLEHVVEVVPDHPSGPGPRRVLLHERRHVLDRPGDRRARDRVKVAPARELDRRVGPQRPEPQVPERRLVADEPEQPALELVHLAVVNAVQVRRRRHEQTYAARREAGDRGEVAGVALLVRVRAPAGGGGGRGERGKVLQHGLPMSCEAVPDRVVARRRARGGPQRGRAALAAAEEPKGAAVLHDAAAVLDDRGEPDEQEVPLLRPQPGQRQDVLAGGQQRAERRGLEHALAGEGRQ